MGRTPPSAMIFSALNFFLWSMLISSMAFSSNMGVTSVGILLIF